MRLNNRIYDALARAVLVVLYFVPYAFMAILAYVRNDTIMGFVLAALITGLLAVLSGVTRHRLVATGGLILSTLTSITITPRYSEEWVELAEPFTPTLMILITMFFIAALSAAIWKIIEDLRKKKS